MNGGPASLVAGMEAVEAACRRRRDRKACHGPEASEVVSDHSSSSGPIGVAANLSALDASGLHSAQNNDSWPHDS